MSVRIQPLESIINRDSELQHTRKYAGGIGNKFLYAHICLLKAQSV